MKSLAIAMATLLVGSVSLAGSPTTDVATQRPLTQNDSREGSSADIPGRDTINESDAEFLKDFARLNAAQVERGKLAKWKAKDAEVKAFAIAMIDSRSQTLGQIQKIAAKANVDVEAEPNLMQKTRSVVLDVNVGASFDKAYMKAMVKEHEKVIEMLEEEIQNGQDENVKQFASDALRDVQKHLKVAQDLRAKVSVDKYESEAVAQSDSSNKDKVVKAAATH
jgi:putative membrane protein